MSYGLGAVLLQFHNDTWQPVAFASRALSETECHYAQIEKEALALTWACEHFSDYILGKSIQLETDHKPLVSLLSYKHLALLPTRILRFCLRLMRFQFTISHVAGKALHTADTLSRAPVEAPPNDNTDKEIECYIQTVSILLPASKDCLDC